MIHPRAGQRPADVAADAQADILGDEHVVDLCRILAGVEQVEGGDTGEGEQHIAGVALENWHGGGMVLLEKQQTRRRQIKDDPGQRNVNGQRQEPEAPTHHRAKHGPDNNKRGTMPVPHMPQGAGFSSCAGGRDHGGLQCGL